MSEQRQKSSRHEHNEDWEVAEDIGGRPLGSVVSVRFEADAARTVRAAARSIGLNLSEFVRRATLAVTESPQLLAKIREPGGSYPYLVVSGNSGNIVWAPEKRKSMSTGEATVGRSVRQQLPGTLGACRRE